MATLDEIKAAVARDTEVTSSAITLLRSIHQQLEEAKADPVKLQEVLDGLNANTDALAAAVSENAG